MRGLIAIDWGTSNLRASLLDAHAGLVEARSAPGGVMKVKDGLYAPELLGLCWHASYTFRQTVLVRTR